MSKHLTRKSDSQANAEALARRSSTYADEHARSWEVKFDRPSHEPRNLRELVHVLRKAYADEVPTRIHNRETDEGGHPDFSPEFKRYLYGSDFATDHEDEIYLTPFRRTLSAMFGSGDLLTGYRARIVNQCVVGEYDPTTAAMACGVPEWCAKIVARDALQVFWRRLSDMRLDLSTEKVA